MKNKSYKSLLEDKLPAVLSALKDRGIEERYLAFGGEGQPSRVRVPTAVFSQFLANRALGDWAEGILADAISAPGTGLLAAHYGDSTSLAAGDNGFKEYYLEQAEQVRKFGKRPDLLLFPTGTPLAKDLGIIAITESDKYLPACLGAIEVRSSSLLANKYISFRKKQLAEGAKVREVPSFTVKIEDLIVVYRWIERTGIGQAYCQVFLDSAYGLNLLDIFAYLGQKSDWEVEHNDKNQFKSTVHIPITQGALIGKVTQQPEFIAVVKESNRGRVESYTTPKGGKMAIDLVALKKTMMLE